VKLDWRPATFADRTLLQRFVCAEPERRYYDRQRGSWHPEPWAWEVQAHLRSRRPPVTDDENLLLGFDAQGIAAAAHVGFDLAGEDFIIFAVARARRCARMGYGAEAIQVALAACLETKQGRDLNALAYGRVHPHNEASRAMMSSAGFIDTGERDGIYEVWVHALQAD
jgi:RimJ/RimL family protein N-acetyltransferase